MFERFSERARQVIVLAQDEARALRHDYLGSEHVLLGFLREEEGIAARVLDQLGITADETRATVARIVGMGDRAAVGQIPFTPNAKRILGGALGEALGLQHTIVGTEHLLLAIAARDESVAATVLLHLGTDRDQVRTAVISALAGDQPRRRRSAPYRQPAWEYRVTTIATRSALSADALDQQGADGWELAAAIGSEPVTLVFKRLRRASG